MHLMRDAAKRLLRLSAIVTLDALDDPALRALCDEVLDQSAVALGLADSSGADRTPTGAVVTRREGPATSAPRPEAPPARDGGRPSDGSEHRVDRAASPD